MKKKAIISALPPLRPYQIIDIKTGELLSLEQHDITVSDLVNYVRVSTETYYADHKEEIESALDNAKRILSPAEWARQQGYSLDLSLLPKNVKAKSRIERLFRHKLVSEVSSYVKNSNPLKQPPSFAPKINLGAVDAQMATLSREGNILSLLLKVWDRELLLEFNIPSYITARQINKWSLPTIEARKKGIYYIFTTQEEPRNQANGNNTAGLDIGRKEPVTMVVVNKRGKRVADYVTPGRVRVLNDKRERILVEKKHILRKARHYEFLGLDNSALLKEAKHKSSKARLLGNEIAKQCGSFVAQKLTTHHTNTLAVEDLRWVTGTKYGGRWVHSKIQSAIEHAASREGISTKKINPRGTSQECHQCGATVTHNTKTRVARCSECKESFDRDFNAAMNIVHRLARYPNQERRIGDNCSPRGQIIETSSHSSDIKNSMLTTLIT